jgi:hypothetical protein
MSSLWWGRDVSSVCPPFRLLGLLPPQVVVLAALLAGLVGLALAGRAAQRLLLRQVLAANARLGAAAADLVTEKERMVRPRGG